MSVTAATRSASNTNSSSLSTKRRFKKLFALTTALTSLAWSEGVAQLPDGAIEELYGLRSDSKHLPRILELYTVHRGSLEAERTDFRTKLATGNGNQSSLTDDLARVDRDMTALWWLTSNVAASCQGLTSMVDTTPEHVRTDRKEEILATDLRLRVKQAFLDREIASAQAAVTAGQNRLVELTTLMEKEGEDKAVVAGARKSKSSVERELAADNKRLTYFTEKKNAQADLFEQRETGEHSFFYAAHSYLPGSEYQKGYLFSKAPTPWNFAVWGKDNIKAAATLNDLLEQHDPRSSATPAAEDKHEEAADVDAKKGPRKPKAEKSNGTGKKKVNRRETFRGGRPNAVHQQVRTSLDGLSDEESTPHRRAEPKVTVAPRPVEAYYDSADEDDYWDTYSEESIGVEEETRVIDGTTANDALVADFKGLSVDWAHAGGGTYLGDGLDGYGDWGDFQSAIPVAALSGSAGAAQLTSTSSSGAPVGLQQVYSLGKTPAVEFSPFATLRAQKEAAKNAEAVVVDSTKRPSIWTRTNPNSPSLKAALKQEAEQDPRMHIGFAPKELSGSDHQDSLELVDFPAKKKKKKKHAPSGLMAASIAATPNQRGVTFGEDTVQTFDSSTEGEKMNRSGFEGVTGGKMLNPSATGSATNAFTFQLRESASDTFTFKLEDVNLKGAVGTDTATSSASVADQASENSQTTRKAKVRKHPRKKDLDKLKNKARKARK